MAGHYAPTRMNPGIPTEVGSQAHYLRRNDTREYKLVVEQQPIRARMCGYGDKDRRPITPPPCIRLVVIDRITQRELDFSEINCTYFVLTADLLNERGSAPVNVVRSSSAAPTVSISSSTTTSYPPPPERTHHYVAMTSYDQQYRHGPMTPQGMTPHGMAPQGMLPYSQPSMQPAYYNGAPPPPPSYAQYPPPYGQSPMPSVSLASQSGSKDTRNLIGNPSINAVRLNDLDGKPSFWFVLQDLSIRTEGTFRLKFFLFDISCGDESNGTVHADGPTQGKGPCIATVLSEPFIVYSAKKFPGVIESTPLSKCFAQQGIKIPIRKDGPKLPNRDEYDDGD